MRGETQPWVYPPWSGTGKQPTGQSNLTLYQIIARTEKTGAQERGELNEAFWLTYVVCINSVSGW